MPSPEHEAPLVLFRQLPGLVVRLLELAGLPVPPDCEVHCGGEERPEVVAAARRVDALLVFSDDGRHELAVIVEVQRRHDDDKYWTWPAYVADVRADHRCPTVLIVLCTDDKTAAGCRQPIPFGHPGLTLVPLVIGPAEVPVVTDPAEAGRELELTMLSVILHGDSPEGRVGVDALMKALDAMGDNEKAGHYAELVLMTATGALKVYVEEQMKSGTFEFQSDYAKELIAEGRAEGEARSVLIILDDRGIPVPEDARNEILACTDPDQAAQWVKRALRADTIDDVLSPDA